MPNYPTHEARAIFELGQSAPSVEKKPKPVLDIRVMLTGDVNRLRYITRHSTSQVVHRENVAEHSYYVALYAMFIYEYCCSGSGVYFSPGSKLRILERSLVHDLDESRTGDFQRPFKYRSDKIREAIEEAAAEEFVTIVVELFPEDLRIRNHLLLNWHHAKDDGYEGRVVAFADFLSVVSYLWAETANANSSIMHHYQTLSEYSSKFDGEDYEFIRPLVKEVQDMVHDMIRKIHAHD